MDLGVVFLGNSKGRIVKIALVSLLLLFTVACGGGSNRDDGGNNTDIIGDGSGDDSGDDSGDAAGDDSGDQSEPPSPELESLITFEFASEGTLVQQDSNYIIPVSIKNSADKVLDVTLQSEVNWLVMPFVSSEISGGETRESHFEISAQGLEEGVFGAQIQIGLADGDSSVDLIKSLSIEVIDEVAPGSVDDLSIQLVDGNQHSLVWTAVGENDLGISPVSHYEVRLSTEEIDEDNWLEAELVTNVDQPQMPKLTETIVLPELTDPGTYFYAVRAYDGESAGGVSNNVEYTVPVFGGALSLSPSTISVSLEQNQTYTALVEASNQSDQVEVVSVSLYDAVNGAVVSQVQQKVSALKSVKHGVLGQPSRSVFKKGEKDLRVGAPVLFGSGGPDNFGYSWVDSDEPSGPEFVWRDITEVGQPVSDLFDDSVSGPISLGFAFSFYGVEYSQIYVSSNGFLTFDPSTHDGCCTGEPMGQNDGIENIISWLWEDLHPKNGQVHYVAESGEFTIQFTDYGEYAGDGTVTAQVKLLDNGEIIFYYKDFSNGLEAREHSVGIENADATDGLQVAFNTRYLKPNLAVAMSSSKVNAWASLAQEVFTISPSEVETVAIQIDGIVEVGEYFAEARFTNESNETTSIPINLVVTADLTAPRSIGDLSVMSSAYENIRLGWTGVADLGINGAISHYEIRYHEEPITLQNWEDLSPSIEHIPQVSEGQRETIFLEGLPIVDQLYFAIRSVDAAGNYSELSNSLVVDMPKPPEVSASVETISVSLVEGQETQLSFGLNNTGLESELSYELFLREINLSTNSKVPSFAKVARNYPVLNALPAAETYVEGELLIKAEKNQDVSAMNSVLAQYGAQRLKTITALNIQLWKFPKAVDLLEVIHTLTKMPSVKYVEPNYKVSVNRVPDDPEFSTLWGLNNEGQTGGLAGADINAIGAWDYFTGSESVVVAVIDTGIDYSHPDLDKNMWVNPLEIPDNNIDDDGNGYIDDVYGYDFVNRDGDPFDDNEHGTHVAGTIGAQGDNGIDVIGVNHNVSLMAVKFLNGFGSGSLIDAIDATMYAADNGADIINNSWGGGGFSQGLLDALLYAQDQDVVVVCAAGNSATDNDRFASYPANYDVDAIISVAATDHNDNLAGFSQYGLTTVDLGAPGVDIMSTVPGGRLDSFDGTSMASPHVAGVAALVKGFNPSLSTLEIKQFILDTVDPVSALDGVTVTGGRLNALEALRAAGTSWLRVLSDFQGVVAANDTIDFEMLINAANLAGGVYQMELVFQTNDPAQPELVIPVVLTVEPDDLAPDAVDDLAFVSATDTSLTISLTATGDDGLIGQASAFDVRYSESPITLENWGQALSASSFARPEPSGATQEGTITELEPNTNYYVATRVVDNVGNLSGLSNVIQGTTSFAQINVSVDALGPVFLNEGETATELFEITNTGNWNLDVILSPNVSNDAQVAPANLSLSVPEFRIKSQTLPQGPSVLSTRSEADEGGYFWVDSRDPLGPAYEWVDISSTGTLIEGLSDDVITGPFDLGFDFPFYGQQYEEFYFSSNGFITFSDDFDHGCCAGQLLPNPSTPNNLIAWMWRDLFPRTDSRVWYELIDDSTLVIQVQDYGEFAGDGLVNAQVILERNGNIRIQFQSFALGMDSNSGSIGLENEDGSIGLQTAFNTDFLEPELAIVFLRSWLSPQTSAITVAPGETESVRVDIGRPEIQPGEYDATLVIDSNDKDQPRIELPVSLEVLSP